MSNKPLIREPQRIYIDWKEIDEDHPPPRYWINAWQCESFVLTYLAKHPERVKKGAILAGIEVKIPSECFEPPRGSKDKPPQADLVFIKDQEYYVVETKESRTQIENAVKDAIDYSKALQRLLEMRRIKYVGITPVGASINRPRTHLPHPTESIPTVLGELRWVSRD